MMTRKNPISHVVNAIMLMGNHEKIFLYICTFLKSGKVKSSAPIVDLIRYA